MKKPRNISMRGFQTDYRQSQLENRLPLLPPGLWHPLLEQSIELLAPSFPSCASLLWQLLQVGT
jgi:hypothetical protein